MTKNNELENLMLEEEMVDKKLKKEKKNYKNPNSKTMMHKIKKLFKK